MPIDLLPPMMVLDDPANPFAFIFSIRKIPNDLLDLERLNRPGESVPSRESRTSTLKGLFLLEGPAAALCIRTADFGSADPSDECRLSGVKRKSSGHRQIDAIDPEWTLGRSVCGRLLAFVPASPSQSARFRN